MEEKKQNIKEETVYKHSSINIQIQEPFSKDTPEKSKTPNKILSNQNSLKLTSSPLSSTSEGKDNTNNQNQETSISRTITPTPILNLDKSTSDKLVIPLQQPTPNEQQSLKTVYINSNINPNSKNIMVSSQNKPGFTSPKNDSGQIPTFKIVSPSFDIRDKPTTMSTLEKRKMNLDNLSLNVNGKINDEEKKEKTTSRLTSPKQMETVIISFENKEKTPKEIDKIINSKNIIKNNNNVTLFNTIQVF